MLNLLNEKKYFNIFKLVLIATTVFFAFAGCRPKNENTSTGEHGSMPKELSVYAFLGAAAVRGGAKDYNDVLSFQMIEKLTGTHVKWIHPPMSSPEERFNLMIASGDYPDIIVRNWRTVSGGINSYVEDKVIIPLTQYIENYMPNLNNYIKQNPELVKEFVIDGETYFIPLIRKDKELCIYQGLLVRKDWLDKLGIDSPKTLDDLYETLKAFKTGDPNGNGIADEIPFSGIGFESESEGIGNLVWPFGVHYSFYLDGNKVKYGPVEDRFEEGLEFIAKLYREDLIDPDYLLNDRVKLDSKILNDKVGFTYGRQPSSFYDEMNNGREFVGAPHLTGPYGDDTVYQSFYSTRIVYNGAAITSSNNNIEGTLKWLDTFFSETGVDIMNWGKEGLSYTRDGDGTPKFTDYILNNQNGRSMIEMRGITLGIEGTPFPTLQEYDGYKYSLSPWGVNSIDTWKVNANVSGVLPTLFFTDDENSVIVRNLSQIRTFVSEQINRTVVGQSSISDWNSVRKRIVGMGLDEVLKVYQDAYDRLQK